MPDYDPIGMGSQENIGDNSGAASSTGTVNSPGLEAVGGKYRAKRRAVANAFQAANIVRRLEFDNRERNLKNARIMAKYNAERPYNTNKLRSEGLAWKANFSTKPLASLIDKAAPRLSTAIEALKYFTSSKLPSNVPNAADKTEVFRREVTETIRSHPEWRPFISEVSQEDTMFGYTGVAWMNEWDWMPKHFRQDSFFVPTGTKQYPDNAQLVVLKEIYLPHQLFENIENQEAAETAGWKIENCVMAINDAMPEQARVRDLDWARIYQDLIRENSVAYSYYTGARVIVAYTVFAREHDGKVTHWRIDGRTYKPLFYREDAYETMRDAVAFYAYQLGNGTMHGSKGIGREIYNLASVLDRSRNEIVDRLHLSGKVIVTGPERDLQRFRMSVLGGVIYIPSNVNVETQRIDGNVEPFIALDQYIQSLMDQLAGNVSPQHLRGERVTKAQVDLFAAREEEKKDSVMARFLIQFSDMVSQIQKRMCNREVTCELAKAMQKRMLDAGLSREEIEQLAAQPSATVVKDYTDLERQIVAMVAAENTGNPLYNQRELQNRKLIAQLGSDFARAVLLPENDPTVVVEQVRLQQMEIMLMEQSGYPVEVSPRDNHEVHLEYCREVYENNFKPLLAENPQELLPVASAVVKHALEHVSNAVSLGSAEKMSGFAAYWNDEKRNLTRLTEHETAATEGLVAGVDPSVAGAAAVQDLDSSGGIPATPGAPAPPPILPTQ